MLRRSVLSGGAFGGVTGLVAGLAGLDVVSFAMAQDHIPRLNGPPSMLLPPRPRRGASA